MGGFVVKRAYVFCDSAVGYCRGKFMDDEAGDEYGEGEEEEECPRGQGVEGFTVVEGGEVGGLREEVDGFFEDGAYDADAYSYAKGDNEVEPLCRLIEFFATGQYVQGVFLPSFLAIMN